MFGIGTVIMAAFSPRGTRCRWSAGALLLASFFFYFMIGLRLREAMRANLIVFGALVVAFAVGTMPTATATYLMFTLFCANIIGFAGSYALEHANRTAFLEHRQLTEVATHDGLTTLLNRAAFEDQIRRVWQQAQRDRQTVAVIMIDIDYFKAYNDRYGHVAGDDCLRRVCERAARRGAPPAAGFRRALRWRGAGRGAVRRGPVVRREHFAQPAGAVRELRIPHASFADPALRHGEHRRGVGGCVSHGQRTTPRSRSPTRRCTPPRTRAAIATWRSIPARARRPDATTVLPLREAAVVRSGAGRGVGVLRYGPAGP